MNIREHFKNALKGSSLGKVIYEPLHKCWRWYNVPRRRRILQKYGDETIQILHKFFNENRIEYYLDFGTLLGIVREGGFIKHDDDIDLTIRHSPIPPKEIIRRLMDMGFEFFHGLYADDKTLEFTVVWKGLQVDMFMAYEDSLNDTGKYKIYGCYYDPHVKYPNANANNYRVWFFPSDLSSVSQMFREYEVCIPGDPEKLLTLEYGKNWKTPNEKFDAEAEKLDFVYLDGFAFRTIIPDALPH